MATATKELTRQEEAPRHKPHEQLPSIAPPRLPYHPAIAERFGVDKAAWKALVEAIFPNATTTESIILALSYCRARKLDPFKRNVHIVPIWNKDMRRYVDTIWPGIGELRTTAFRTSEYAGRGEAKFGVDITRTFKGSVGKSGSERHVEQTVTFPEWAQVTVYRMVKGQRVEFAGPKVYWVETYATIGASDVPNDMWADRPRGQLEKCAEAAALRAAFPEEFGGDYIPEEVQHAGAKTQTVEGTAVETLDTVADRLLGSDGEAKDETAADPPEDTTRPQTTEDVDAELLDLARMDIGASTDEQGVDFVAEPLLRRAPNDATKTAIAGLVHDRKAALREAEKTPAPKGKK